MKKRKFMKSIIAMTALIAMLMENTFSVMAAVTTEGSFTSNDTAITAEPLTDEGQTFSDSIESKEESLITDADETDATIVASEPEIEPVISTGEEAPLVESDGSSIQAKGVEDLTLYVNTDRMVSSDSFELEINGGTAVEYSSDLMGLLSKNRGGVYHIRGLGLAAVSIKAIGLSNGMTAEYVIRSDGNPQISLISRDTPDAEKKLRITDSGFEVKGSGYEELSLKLDGTSLPGSAEYSLYIKTKADVRCNGDVVKDGIVTPLLAEETSLRLSNLNDEAFTIYVKGSSSDKIYAEYSIDSASNGIVAAMILQGDNDVEFTHEDEEDTEDEKEVKNEKRIYEYEDADVYVTASLEDPEAIPDDADFVVTKITPSTNGYNYDAYMQALNDNADKITGEDNSTISEGDVLLYDIAFYGKDEEGNKIELQPEAGAVRINIRFKKDQLKDELGAETSEDVKTVHLPLAEAVKEDVNTTAEATDISASDIKVEVVADSTSVEGEKVAFTLSDFSAVAVFVNGRMAPGPDETFKTILGNASVHGVVANYLNASGHFETNFAAGTLDGGANVATCKNDSNNAGVTYIGDYVGSGFFMDPNGNSSPALVYTTEAALKNMHESMQKRTRTGVVIDSTTYNMDQIQSRVASLVSKVDAKSEALADVAAYEFSSVANGNLLDIASKGSGAGTHYVNFNEGEYAEAAKNGLSINLAEGQKIILTIPDKDVVFTQITVNGHAAGGTPEEDEICQSVVLNCPNAETAKTGGSVAAVVLVPKADFTSGTVSAGWLVANRVIDFSSEWHCVWHDMPPASECSTTIEAEKTVDFNTPTKDQKFWFDLYSYDWNTKETTLIQSVQNNGRKVIFDPFYYNAEGVYSYVLKERMENDAFAHDPNEYTIHIKVRKNTDLNQYEIYEKNIYKKNSLTREDSGCVGHEDDGTVIKFNNQTTPRVPFDFTITKLFYQNDGTNWKNKRLIDKDVFKDYGFGNDWPDGASFTFDLERFDGKPTNSGIRMDSPLPQKKTITLTKDNRTDSFGKVFFDADTNWNNYGDWERSWDEELKSWVLTKIYMYKITERIPDDAHKIPGVVYTKRPVYIKLFVQTYWQGNSAKIRILGRASYVNDNSVSGQECFSVSEADLEFVNAYYSGSLKVKKNAFDIDGKKVDSDKDFYAVVYRKSGNNKIYYGKDGKENLYPVAEAVKGNSEIQFKPLPLGYVYYVYESDADGKQITGSKVYEVSYQGLSKDGSVNIDLCNMNKEVTINNKRKPGSLRLIKSDPAKAIKLAGAEFELYKGNERYPDSKTTYMTDANGEILVNSLPWGTYRFKEIVAPEGYKLPQGDDAFTESKEINENTVGDTITIDADNDKILGDLLLHKVVKEGDEFNPLAGATFRLYSSDEKNNKQSVVKTSGASGVYRYDEEGVAQELATDSQGNLSVTGLPYGTYRIYEEKAPEGFVKDNNVKKFTINGNPKVVEFNFENTKIKANVEFIKVEPTDEPVAGITFTLFKKKTDGADFVGNYISKENGHVRADGLGAGSYYFTENPDAAYTGYNGDLAFEIKESDHGKTITLPGPYRVVNDLALVENTPVLGQVELFKYEMKSGKKTGLPDAEFALYKDGQKIDKVYKTDPDGFIREDKLEWGSYYFEETKAPIGFKPNPEKKYFEISRTSLSYTGAARIELENTPITGKVELIKLDKEDKVKELSGVKFELYSGTPENPAGLIGTYVTENGRITSDTIGELDYGNYFFKEIETIPGYKLNDTPYTFAITEQDVTVYVKAENERLPGKVVLEKYDSNHSHKLDGAVFDLYSTNPSNVFQQVADFFGRTYHKQGEYTTTNGGVITVEGLEWGSYFFVETKAPTGYVLDSETKHTFVIDESNLYEELTYEYHKEAVNKEETGTIKLIKDNGEGQLLEGAEFSFYKDDVRYPNGETKYTTDDKGEIIIRDLPWGTYYFVETKAPEGFVQPKEGDAWAKTESVTIDADNTVSTVPFKQVEQTNQPIYGSLSLKKIDGKGNELTGAEFSLVQVVDGAERNVKVTGSAGVYEYVKTAGFLSIKENLKTNGASLSVNGLPYGAYKVYEEKAPEGYKKIDDPFEFVITEQGETKYIKVINSLIKADVEFIKAEIDYTELKGAVFELIRKDGDKEDSLGFVTSGSDGKVERKELGVGDYYFIERIPAKGHILNTKKYTFSITPDDNGKTVRLDNADMTRDDKDYVVNERLKGKVKLWKAIEGTNTGLAGAEFELYKGKETAPLKTDLTSDDLGYVRVDSLEWGTYYFKETKAPEGYVLEADKKYEFKIDEENVEGEVTVDLKGKELRVDNKPIIGQAQIIKQDSVSKKPIEKAVFALYNVLDDDNPVPGYERMISDKAGVIKTNKDLKAGRYYFKEVEAAKGYKLNPEKYGFEITQENMDTVVTAGEDGIVENTPIPGKAELFKYTSLGDDEKKGVAGATITLYQTKTYLGIFKIPKVYATFTTTESGMISIDGLPWGDYYFQETKAPKGYEGRNTEYKFTIDAEHLDYTGEHKFSHPNTPLKGSVKLIKNYAINGKKEGTLEGAKFKFYSKDSITGTEIKNEKTQDGLYVTDSNGEIIITGLDWGTYYFEEVSAPEGYALPEDTISKELNINADNVEDSIKTPLTAEMTNDKIYGNVELFKVNDATPVSYLSGAQFELYKADGSRVYVEGADGDYTYASGENQTVIVTPDSGRIVVKQLPYGEYYFVETVAPEKYNINPEKLKFTIVKNQPADETPQVTVTCVDSEVYANVEFIKVDTWVNNPLAGVVFSLNKVGAAPDGSDLPISEVTSDDEGYVRYENLSVGKYYFKEISVPDNAYKIRDIPFTFEIKAKDAGNTVTIDNPDQLIEADGRQIGVVINERELGMVKLIKYYSIMEGERKILPGAKFKLFMKHDDGSVEPLKEYTVNDEGFIYEENLEWGSYYFQEIYAPDGYKFEPDKKYEFEINSKNVRVLQEGYAINDQIPGKVDLFKIDEEDNIPLTGVEFTLYKDYGKADQSTIGILITQDGKAEKDGLLWGDYTLKETKTLEGYVLSDKLYNFTIDGKNLTKSFTGVDSIKNEKIKGYVELLKKGVKNKPLSEIRFDLYKGIAPAGKYQATYKTNNQGKLVDDKGNDKIGPLNYGDYYFVETVPTGYMPFTGDLSFKIERKDQLVSFTDKRTVYNTPKPGSVILKKTDENAKPLANAEFTLYSKDPETLAQSASVLINDAYVYGKFTTDDNGMLKVEGLKWGDYYFKETKAPKGYKILEPGKEYEFTIDENSTEESVDIGTIANKQLLGTLELTKKDAETGTELEGAEFKLFKIEKDRDIDVSASYGATAGVFRTNDKGKITVTDVKWGSYYFKETKAPKDYEEVTEADDLRSPVLTIDADKTDDEGQFIQPQTTTVKNKRGYGYVSLLKVFDGEQPESLSGIEFALVNDTKQTEVGRFSTDGNGVISAETIGRLTYGDYHFEELSVPVGVSYNVSDFKPAFTISRSNPVEDPIQIKFVNSEVRASAKFVKIDPDTQEIIPGVKFFVYEAGNNETPFTTVESDVNGIVAVTHMPMGSFYFLEDLKSAAEKGYRADYSKYEFTVTKDDMVPKGEPEKFVPVYREGTLVEVKTVPNEKENGSIELVKLGKSVDGSEKKLSVKDAGFELYKDGKLFMGSDEVAGYIKGDRLVIDGLSWGTYYFKEIRAPKGYALPADGADKTNEVILDGTNVTDSLTTPLICQMSDDTLRVFISKRQIGSAEELAGASMELYEADEKGAKTGKPILKWISGASAKLIEIGDAQVGVIQGKTYVIHEDMAPVGYALTEDIVFTVNEDGSVKTEAKVIGSGNGTVIVMEDAPFDISISKKELGTDTELAGATLRIMDGDNVLETWISTGKPHAVEKTLSIDKDYVLEETDPPKGYYTAEPITFFVNKEGKIRIKKDASASAEESTVSSASGNASTLTMYDRPIRVEISKKRLSGGEEDYVEGAKLALYEQEGEKYKQIFSWISPKSGSVLIDYGMLTVGKKYRVSETETPAGYIKAADLYFTVKDYDEFEKTDADGRVTQSIAMFDGVVNIVVSKKAITGEDELASAVLQIVDESGRKMADIVTGSKQTLITSIASKEELSEEEKASYEKYNVIYGVRFETGKSYILKEVKAPAGYALAKDVIFKIDEQGVQNPSPVVMIDKPLELKLSKKDIGTGAYLKGASMELYNSDNEKVVSWVSSDKPVLLSMRDIDDAEAANYAQVFKTLLPAGEYRLHEAAAPEGYALADDVVFTVDGACVRSDSGEIREESMYDHKDGKTNIYGDKIWNTPKDSTGELPGDYEYPEITLELYRDSAVKGKMDDTPIKSVTLKNGATSFAFGDLDRYKKEGKDNYEYTYKVVEVMSDAAKKQYTCTELDMVKTEQGLQALYNVKVVNNLNQEYTYLNGTKTFVLKKDLDGKLSDTQYAEITIWLLQNGKRVDIDGDGKEESVTITNGAKETNGKAVFTFKDLPKYDLNTGNEYSYTVEEEGAQSYGCDVVYKGNEVNIFNTPKENPFYIKGIKKWIDPEGTSRPDVTMQLFRDGVLYKETKLNEDYTFSFGPLYEYNLGWANDEGDNKSTADGHKFLYEIKEIGAIGYNVTIEGSGKDMVITGGAANVTVTNHFKQEYIEIRGKKFWNDAGDSSRRPSVTINLYSSDSVSGKEALIDTYVIPNTKTTYEFGTKGRVQLPKYDANGKEITYRVEEVAIPGYISVQNGNDFTNTPSKVRISKLDATDSKELPGAVLSLSKSTSKTEVERWTSTSTPHYIEGLEMGIDYTLTEISAPKGYVLADPITFKVNTDGVEQKIEMIDDPIIGSVVLTKLDSETREKLSGAVFNLYGPDGKIIRANGVTGDYTYSNTGTGTTDLSVSSSGELKVDKLPYGAYYFKEVSAPDGYELSSETVSFTIADKNAAVTVSFVNTRRKGRVTLVKTNEDGSERLAGAEFELYSRTPRTTGQAAASTIFSDAYYRYGTYTTDSDGRIRVDNLPWDDYYFLETKAPSGYQVNRDLTGDPLVYTFTVHSDNAGTIEIDLGSITNSKSGEVLGERRPIAEKASGVLGVRSKPKGGVLGTRVGPATGDVSAIALWLAVMVACIGTIIWLLSSKKRKTH